MFLVAGSSFSMHLWFLYSHRISGVASNGGVMRLALSNTNTLWFQMYVLYVLLLSFSFACDVAVVVFVFALQAAACTNATFNTRNG